MSKKNKNVKVKKLPYADGFLESALANLACTECDFVIHFKKWDKYESWFLKPVQHPFCPKCNGVLDRIDQPKKLYGGFMFKDPVGTDRWNNSHDYRFYHNLPKVKAERANAAKKARTTKGLTSPNPYNKIDDVSKGTHFGDVK